MPTSLPIIVLLCTYEESNFFLDLLSSVLFSLSPFHLFTLYYHVHVVHRTLFYYCNRIIVCVNLVSLQRCDADPSALSKYIVALLRKEKPRSALKELCINQLEVFLSKGTAVV